MVGDRSGRVGRGERAWIVCEPVSVPRRLDRRFLSRSAALGEGAEGDRSSDFELSSAWSAADVAVFEPVGTAFAREDLGVMDEPVDHHGGDDLVAEDLAPGGRRGRGRRGCQPVGLHALAGAAVASSAGFGCSGQTGLDAAPGMAVSQMSPSFLMS